MVRKYRPQTVIREIREPATPDPVPQSCGALKGDGTQCVRPKDECQYHGEAA